MANQLDTVVATKLQQKAVVKYAAMPGRSNIKVKLEK